MVSVRSSVFHVAMPGFRFAGSIAGAPPIAPAGLCVGLPIVSGEVHGAASGESPADSEIAHATIAP
jgi:hypothetical protein